MAGFFKNQTEFNDQFKNFNILGTFNSDPKKETLCNFIGFGNPDNIDKLVEMTNSFCSNYLEPSFYKNINQYIKRASYKNNCKNEQLEV